MKRRDLRNGDILFCKKDSFLSKLKRFVTSSDVSHVAMIVKIYGQPWVVDSRIKGTYLIPFERWQKETKYDFFVVRGSRISEEELLSRVKPFIGVNYSIQQEIVKYLNLRFGFKIKSEDLTGASGPEVVLISRGCEGGFKSTAEDALFWFLTNGYDRV